MKLKQPLVGLALVAIAISLFALPVSAGIWRRDDDYDEYYIFWVSAHAGGLDEGSFFSAHEKWWDHGPAMDPPPPWIFCDYDAEYTLKFDGQGRLYYVKTDAWGDIELKTGEYVTTISATAEVNAKWE